MLQAVEEIKLKVCSICKTEKTLDNFGFSKGGRYQRRAMCKPCYNDANRHWNRKRLYNISKNEYEELLLKYNNVCAICKQPAPKNQSLCVDHDHSEEKITGKIKIRGLLCKACNRALGKFNDDPYIVEKAIKYLERNHV